MDAFSRFKTIIYASFWKQQPSSTLNYLCTTPNCYSTCDVRHPVPDDSPRRVLSCSKCNHLHLSHFQLRSTWEQVYETQLSVDYCMIMKQWDAAKDEKERTDALLAMSKGALEDLGRIIYEAMDELAPLAEGYVHLLLSGNPSMSLEKVIRLLEQHCKRMEETGVGLELLARIRIGLERMKERLDLLRKAEEKAEEEAREVRRLVHDSVRAIETTQYLGRKVHETVQAIEEVVLSGLEVVKEAVWFWR